MKRCGVCGKRIWPWQDEIESGMTTGEPLPRSLQFYNHRGECNEKAFDVLRARLGLTTDEEPTP